MFQWELFSFEREIIKESMLTQFSCFSAFDYNCNYVIWVKHSERLFLEHNASYQIKLIWTLQFTILFFTDDVLFSRRGRMGRILSPRHTLPPNTTCTYYFHGHPGDLVWLSFTSYNLQILQHAIQDNNTVDRVSARISMCIIYWLKIHSCKWIELRKSLNFL